MAQEFDVEALYKIYPRKEGKRLGVERFKARIKTQEQYEQVKQAIINYNALQRTRGKDVTFTLLFSTFANRWEDYIDTSPLEGKSSNRSLAEQIISGEI